MWTTSFHACLNSLSPEYKSGFIVSCRNACCTPRAEISSSVAMQIYVRQQTEFMVVTARMIRLQWKLRVASFGIAVSTFSTAYSLKLSFMTFSIW
jgi:hypothetical protein